MGRFSRIRGKAGPWMVWLGSLGVAAWLFADTGTGSQTLGFARAVNYRISPTSTGKVEAIAVELGQHVEAGQVVATLDPRELDAQIRIEEAERARVVAEVEAREARTLRRVDTRTRRSDRRLDDAALAFAEAKGDLRADEAALEAMTELRDATRERVESGLARREDLASLEVRWAELNASVAASRRELKLLRKRQKEAKGRRETLYTDDIEATLTPLRRELGVIDSRLALLRSRKTDLVLRAPVAGRVAAITTRDGGVARAGRAFITVVADTTDRVVACVAEERAMRIHVGMRASLRPRGLADVVLTGSVVSLGAEVSQVPRRCRPDPRLTLWGREVEILLAEAANLVPGQTFDVELESPETNGNGAHAAPSAPPLTQPRPLEVPEALRRISRFEPSGLVWVPRLARYVVVSDDTGRDGKKGREHAPWLFSMSSRGEVDPQPLVIAGVDGISDLESIAHGPDGGLYLLTSHSRSKKGKRPEARRLFLRLAARGLTFQVDGSVDLLEVIEQADPELREALGLGAGTDDLDIEGLSAMDGALLIGLKAPLDEHGNAIIWRLARPEALFAGEPLADCGIELWARVALEVKADGELVPGGIAELLGLPDGSWVIASTASGIDPDEEDSSLWYVAEPERGLLRARRFRIFPGMKAEGLALSPRAGYLTVTFDAGKRTPSWIELPWPHR